MPSAKQPLAILLLALIVLTVGCGPAIDRDTVTVDTPDGTTEALVFSGEGSANFSINVDASPHIMVVEGDAPNGFFVVRAHESPAMMIGPFNFLSRLAGNFFSDVLGVDVRPHSMADADVVGDYTGTVPLHVLDDHHTRSLEVWAHGPWTVQVMPLAAADRISVPGTINGTTDHVFLIDDSASSMTVTGNEEGRRFSITGYGQERHSLFGTIDPVTEATVTVPDDVSIVFVRAAGDWEVTVE